MILQYHLQPTCAGKPKYPLQVVIFFHPGVCIMEALVKLWILYTRGSRKEGSRTVQVVAPSGQSSQNRVKGKEELKARRGGLREGHSMNGENYI